jgi:hypothetical protein
METHLRIGKKKSEFRIGQFAVTIDAEDLARIGGKQWQAINGERGTVRFVTDIGRPGEPVYQLLQNFIVNAPGHTLVTFKDQTPAGSLNLCRSNLVVNA